VRKAQLPQTIQVLPFELTPVDLEFGVLALIITRDNSYARYGTGKTSPGVLRYQPVKTAFFLREFVFTLHVPKETSPYVDRVNPPKKLLGRTGTALGHRLFTVRLLPDLIDGVFFSRRIGTNAPVS
jgi:hypothetical protein